MTSITCHFGPLDCSPSGSLADREVTRSSGDWHAAPTHPGSHEHWPAPNASQRPWPEQPFMSSQRVAATEHAA
eukprot:CAMPEP_0202062796 /NCGR_PEP_ID=MMETSP0963-20130614/44801_1 /ASSEMBLY_ACC=CAM_ASM_000494 /TAXON_ID=4773 /ORGANISM="Schizochytrium aggregatum, Strain ATCC28209" /LENGTH=72 /DNA_ID=CAMNT_0048629133 /DNA_START=154 /DNA_END=368 /DNA_ORIENTATION=+